MAKTAENENVYIKLKLKISYKTNQSLFNLSSVERDV